jgi:hypothetical protein
MGTTSKTCIRRSSRWFLAAIVDCAVKGGVRASQLSRVNLHEKATIQEEYHDLP